MRWTRTGIVVLTGLTLLAPPAASVAAEDVAPTAQKTSDVLVARPAEVDFKSKKVGTENYKRTKITNSGPAAVRLLTSAGLPDDFGYGLMPGQTCPVFDPGDIIAAGGSCYAVVRFSPTEGFVGWQAMGTLIGTARDPDTGAVVDEIEIPVLGRAVL